MNPTPLPLDWRADALQAQLAPLWPGLEVEVQAELASTNTTLLERARAGNAAPTLLVAEAQSGGRGRQGRSWIASAGASLTFSLGVPLALNDWSGLSLAVGCAIAEALDQSIQLKWPNDIWLKDRKLGGILIETVAAENGRYAVIGIGLNIAPIDADPAQFQTGFAALQELHSELTAPQTLARIAPALLHMLRDFGHQGFGAWQAAYARRDLTLGRRITAGTLEGVSRGVNAAGELMLQTALGMRAVSSGEVSVRFEPPVRGYADTPQGGAAVLGNGPANDRLEN